MENRHCVRRIAEIFFFALFAWFWRGHNHWRPLVAIAAAGRFNWLLHSIRWWCSAHVADTKTVYAGLLWALATVVLTILLGRFFCGWVCPFGALHQFIGWLGRRRKKHAERVAMNQ